MAMITTLPHWRVAIILSIMVVPLALLTLSSSASAMQEPNPRAASRRFLLLGRSLRSGDPPEKVQKGDRCDAESNNICPGVSVRNGTEFLQCCKTHCRDVLSDRNNCGACGKRCGFGQLCCGGACTAVAYDVNNCGECGIKCRPGDRCAYGTCGYA